jgi:predicted oxidoreductase
VTVADTVVGTRADVVVVGGGIAGLAAATEAARLGAAVVLVESSPRLGGAALISGGGICVAGSSTQERQGVQDDPDTAFDDWVRWGGDTVDAGWARAYLDAARVEVHDALQDIGVEWMDVLLYEGNRVPRWHRPRDAGRGLVAALVREADRAGVRVLLDTTVTGLRPVGGGVHDVVLSTGSTLVATAVVVAAGGFCDDRDTLAQHVPWLADVPRWLCGNAAGAKGSGLRLVRERGGATTALDAVWVYPVGTPDPEDPSGSRGLTVRGLVDEIWVNRDGVRFHDEDRRGGATGTPALRALPGATSYGVFADRELDRMRLLNNGYWSTGGSVNDGSDSRPGMAREFLDRSPWAWSADSIDELGRLLPLPEGALRRTVETYNRQVQAGGIDEFGKDLSRHQPLTTGPFHAIRYIPVVQKNLGGVLTDLATRVLDVDGAVVPGLFAAGEVAGMAGGHINGAHALEGTMLGPCYYSGRIAGRNAAKSPSGPNPAVSRKGSHNEVG